MDRLLRRDAEQILSLAIRAVLPDEAVRRALEGKIFPGKVILVSAGGYVDSDTYAALNACGLSVHEVLRENDAYHALKAVEGLLFTGPTGTNVNDVAVALLKRP